MRGPGHTWHTHCFLLSGFLFSSVFIYTERGRRKRKVRPRRVDKHLSCVKNSEAETFSKQIFAFPTATGQGAATKPGNRDKTWANIVLLEAIVGNLRVAVILYVPRIEIMVQRAICINPSHIDEQSATSCVVHRQNWNRNLKNQRITQKP